MPRRRIPAAANPLVALAERCADAQHAILVVQEPDGAVLMHALPQTENAITQAGLLAHAMALVTGCDADPAPRED